MERADPAHGRHRRGDGAMSPLLSPLRPLDLSIQQTRPSIMHRKHFLFLCALALAALLGTGNPALATGHPMEREGDVLLVPHPALAATPGVTALVGQVMTTDGQPLANVALRDGGAGTRTNEKGEFLLENLLSPFTMDDVYIVDYYETFDPEGSGVQGLEDWAKDNCGCKQ